MSNKLNLTGLTYFYNRLKTVFASKTELGTLSDRVDEIIAEGGEPNVIESIKKNGTALTPDANKAVDISVPVSSSDLSDGSTLATKTYVDENGGKIDKIKVNGTEQTITNKEVDLTVPVSSSDLSDGSSLATKTYVDQNGGKIDVIKVNGTSQTITNKEVDLTVPTKTSDITNDSGFQTASDVQTAINTAVASAYKYKGSVATVADLPASGNTAGDVYDVQATGMNYAWTGSAWDPLGWFVDMTAYWSKAELVDITTAEIDAIIDGE